MCDTFVALPDHNASGNLIFGKNSDREPNEAQSIVRLPGRDTDESLVRCTFIEIPQVARTLEVILSKPFQMWGAEMGVNEHGVVIGNEAVFTKIKFEKSNLGLTGMDLVRLALERCSTAKQALRTITELLKTYGQDACGGHHNENFFYHNSFLIADTRSAWVLETAGRHWVAERVEGFRSISNGLTIESNYDMISEDAIDFAIQAGWAKSRETFSFRRAYSDWLYTKASKCRRRQRRSTKLGQSKAQLFDVPEAIEILSSHDCDDEHFDPCKSSSASICMHATGTTNPSQTNGSMIAEIRQDAPSTVWLTGTSMPCLSVYMPFFFADSDTHEHPLSASQWNSPSGKVDGSFWWQAERLHRHVCRDYRNRAHACKEFRHQTQQQFLQDEQRLSQTRADLAARRTLSHSAVGQISDFIESAESKTYAAAKTRGGFLYRHHWRRINRRVGLS